jgi:hypothetical protein
MTLFFIGGRVSCSVLFQRCSGILLVLEHELDDLGLWATAGTLNPIDVLVIDGQDCLQLLLGGRNFDMILFFDLLNNEIFT